MFVIVVTQTGQYFPQTLDACLPPEMATLVNGTLWSTVVYLGDTIHGKNQDYDLVLVAVDPNGAASQTIRDYFSRACRNMYMSIPGIPVDAIELASITVMTHP